jgi:hypothetical protein
LASTCIAVYSCRKSKTRFLLFFLIVRSGLRRVDSNSGSEINSYTAVVFDCQSL